MIRTLELQRLIASIGEVDFAKYRKEDLMTDIKLVQGLLEEIHGKAYAVYEYTNVNNNRRMFAVFLKIEHCDIFSSPAVKDPVLIWNAGRWLEDYEYLN